MVLVAWVWGYNIGHLDAPQPMTDERLNNMEQVRCDDIVSPPNSSELVCEVTLRSKNDNIKIFKGIGTYESN